MNSPAEITFDQALNELELRIACRADELAHHYSHPTSPLAAWEQAEREIWTASLREIEATLPELGTTAAQRARALRPNSFLASSSALAC
jgi:hypothetical protein